MRAELKADMAVAEQKQQLVDIEFANKSKRAISERDLRRAEFEHELALKQAKEDAEAAMRLKRQKETMLI
jgi:hypothetical protein